MAFYGITPPTNSQDDFNVEHVTIGISKIVVDDSWIGLLKEGSKAILNYNPLNKSIVSANYPGTTLGMRNMGESPTLRFEGIESTLENFKLFSDVRGIVTQRQGSAHLGLGRRQAVATSHTVTVYTEGAYERTRRWEFYRVNIEIDGDVNIGDPDDFVTFPVLCHILPQRTLPEASWYGEVSDSIP